MYKYWSIFQNASKYLLIIKKYWNFYLFEDAIWADIDILLAYCVEFILENLFAGI